MKVDIFKTSNKYQIIYADPPWSYSDKGCSGACVAHYDTMSVADIAALPAGELAAKDAVLFLWTTYPKLDEALQVIKAWGFKFKSIGFQWVKLNKTADIDALRTAAGNSETVEEALKKLCFFGLGRWTRGNSEPCLIAVKGKPSRISANVGQLIFAPLGKHSTKPTEVRERITALMGELPRIELFARSAADGWDCWGNEAAEDKRQPLLPKKFAPEQTEEVTCPKCGAWIGTKYLNGDGSCYSFMASSDFTMEGAPCKCCQEEMTAAANE